MNKFKASEYVNYNSKFGFNRYKELYNVLEEIFVLLPINTDDFEDDSFFEYDGMLCFVDKKFGSHCEIKGTGRFDLKKRIRLHLKKLKSYKSDIIQLKIGIKLGIFFIEN